MVVPAVHGACWRRRCHRRPTTAVSRRGPERRAVGSPAHQRGAGVEIEPVAARHQKANGAHGVAAGAAAGAGVAAIQPDQRRQANAVVLLQAFFAAEPDGAVCRSTTALIAPTSGLTSVARPGRTSSTAGSVDTCSRCNNRRLYTCVTLCGCYQQQCSS